MQETLSYVMPEPPASRETGQGILLGLPAVFAATPQGHRGAEVPLRQRQCAEVEGAAEG